VRVACSPFLPLVGLVCLTACAVAPPAPAPSSAPTCARWATLSRDQHSVVIGSLLEQTIGMPQQSDVAGCLWTISDSIADHVSDLCAQRGDPYSEAVRVAFESAVAYCRERTKTPAQL